MEVDLSEFGNFNGLFDGEFLISSKLSGNVDGEGGIFAAVAKVR